MGGKFLLSPLVPSSPLAPPIPLLQLFRPGNNRKSWHHDCKMFQFRFQQAFTSFFVWCLMCECMSVSVYVCVCVSGLQRNKLLLVTNKMSSKKSSLRTLNTKYLYDQEHNFLFQIYYVYECFSLHCSSWHPYCVPFYSVFVQPITTYNILILNNCPYEMIP